MDPPYEGKSTTELTRPATAYERMLRLHISWVLVFCAAYLIKYAERLFYRLLFVTDSMTCYL